MGGIPGLADSRFVGSNCAVHLSGIQKHDALRLGVVVFVAMTGACVASGVTGVVVPLALKRVGADPATASSIFLTTATDVISMGLFLWLANTFVLG